MPFALIFGIYILRLAILPNSALGSEEIGDSLSIKNFNRLCLCVKVFAECVLCFFIACA